LVRCGVPGRWNSIQIVTILSLSLSSAAGSLVPRMLIAKRNEMVKLMPSKARQGREKLANRRISSFVVFSLPRRETLLWQSNVVEENSYSQISLNSYHGKLYLQPRGPCKNIFRVACFILFHRSRQASTSDRRSFWSCHL
jgi:hypothetical protein